MHPSRRYRTRPPQRQGKPCRSTPPDPCAWLRGHACVPEPCACMPLRRCWSRPPRCDAHLLVQNKHGICPTPEFTAGLVYAPPQQPCACTHLGDIRHVHPSATPTCWSRARSILSRSAAAPGLSSARISTCSRRASIAAPASWPEESQSNLIRESVEEQSDLFRESEEEQSHRFGGSEEEQSDLPRVTEDGHLDLLTAPANWLEQSDLLWGFDWARNGQEGG